MKKIFVLRHADKNKKTGQLTDEGKKRAEALQYTFPEFQIIISSDRPRTKETAFLLTGKEPELDEHAGFVYSSEEEKESLSQAAKTHPLSHAGVIFGDKKFEALAKTIGTNMVSLIKEVFQRLPDDGIALIVSQDGVMIAAEKILKHESFETVKKYYKPLEGYIVQEDLTVKSL